MFNHNKLMLICTMSKKSVYITKNTPGLINAVKSLFRYFIQAIALTKELDLIIKCYQNCKE